MPKGKIELHMNDILECEGYKMFRGALRVTPRGQVPAFVEAGVCLYRPDTGCWYINGRSFSASICEVAETDR